MNKNIEDEKGNNNEENSKKHNSRIFKTIVIFLLIVIIVLLLLRGCSDTLGRTDFLQPTGDYDIIEIVCNCDSCTDTDDNLNKTNQTGTSANITTGENSSLTGNNDYVPDENKEGLIVYDKKDEWTGMYVANIFTHSAYEVLNGKIAPGSTNIYKFVVNNLNPFKVKYKISFVETNVKDIPMKYRLKKENNYIIGSSSQWVDASNLAVGLSNLNANSLDNYYLEWKWFHEDGSDFTIGVNDKTTYSLNIKVDAEEE